MPDSGFSDSASSAKPLVEDLPRLQSLISEVLSCAGPDGFLTEARMKEQLLQKNTSADQAVVLFSIIDSDGLKNLSDDEAGEDQQLHEKDVAVLLDSLKQSQKLSPYLQRALKRDSPFRSDVDMNWRLLSHQSSLNLYGDRAMPLSSITGDACKQARGVGNCHFVAAMTSTAATKPQAIFSMIEDKKDGRYDVTFPGLKPVTVERPGAGELLWYGLSSRRGIWPAVLQKAYGQLCDPKAKYAIEGGDGGSICNHGLKVMTGGSVNEDINWATRYSTSHYRMQKAFAESRPVMAGIKGEVLHVFGLSDNREDYSRLYGNHAYAVIGFQPNSDSPEEALITLQDPSAQSVWNRADNIGVPEGITDLGSGRFRMNLRSFHKIFSSAKYADLSPPSKSEPGNGVSLARVGLTSLQLTRFIQDYCQTSSP